MKKFTVPCDFGGKKAPFTIYIGEPEPTHHPLHFQADWLAKERGGTIPAEVMDSIAKLYELAQKNNVSFEELCVYALNTAKEDPELDPNKEYEQEVAEFGVAPAPSSWESETPNEEKLEANEEELESNEEELESNEEDLQIDESSFNSNTGFDSVEEPQYDENLAFSEEGETSRSTHEVETAIGDGMESFGEQLENMGNFPTNNEDYDETTISEEGHSSIEAENSEVSAENYEASIESQYQRDEEQIDEIDPEILAQISMGEELTLDPTSSDEDSDEGRV